MISIINQIYMNDLYNCFKKISAMLRFNNIDELTTDVGTNMSEDIVIQMDKIANDLIIDFINSDDSIIGYISEENENIVFKEEIKLYDNNKKYILTFDPLDGSKNISSNITCGTIYSLLEYDYNTDTILNIAEAGYCLYGPSTILVTAIEKSVKLYQLNAEDDYEFLKNAANIPDNKIYHCNEGYSDIIDTDIKDILQNFKINNYSLRWIGSMVADCHQILMNGGLFLYTGNKKNNNGKIRFYYEALPFAFIFKQLDGIALNHNFNDILENLSKKKLKSSNIHATVPIILCNKNDERKINEFLDYNNTINC